MRTNEHGGDRARTKEHWQGDDQGLMCREEPMNIGNGVFTKELASEQVRNDSKAATKEHLGEAIDK